MTVSHLKYLDCAMIVAIPAALAGCSSGSPQATAVLQFSNVNNSPLALHEQIQRFFLGYPAVAATVSTPTTFRMKLIAAYLAQDMDPTTGNNVGGTAILYMNPDCSEDISHCDISAGTAEDGSSFSHLVTSYFDFGQSSSAVNTALNAQGRAVTAGVTYKYVRLEFCKLNSANSYNIVWAGGSSGGDVNFRRNQCSVNSAEMTPPLAVTPGSSVTVSLAYDYSAAISVGSDATGDDCTGSGSTKTCFTLPTFTPSAR